METIRSLIKELETTDSISRRDTIIEKIEKLARLFADALIKDLYHGWWAWEYYEDADQDSPSFSVNSNTNENFLFFYVSVKTVYGMVEIDGKMVEIDLSNKIPLDWLDKVAEEKEKAETLIKRAIDGYNITQENLKKQRIVENAEKKAKRELELKLKQQIVEATATTFTEEQKWAFNLTQKPPQSIIAKLKENK